MLARRAALLAGATTAVAGFWPLGARAAGVLPPAVLPAWADILAAGRGQEVFFNAWGGDQHTNDFIAWTATQVEAAHGVRLRQVRLADTADAVARVVAERAAGRATGGSVDLIWINGPNFLAMQQRGLLFGPVLEALPNARLIDRVGKPTLVDFTVPTQGYEVPWRMAQVVFIHDDARIPDPPRRMAAMPDWARAHPGRLTHPAASNFLGATFLKQALVELAPDRAALSRPADARGYARAAGPLWSWYAALRPHLWHGGRDFPENGPAQAALLQDGEIDLYISFNPAEAALGIADGTLPPSVRAYVLEGGTLANCSFVAIPYDAAHWQGAAVVADFLLSPVAQAHAADPAVLGAPTVLAMDRLGSADQALFQRLPRLPGLLSAAELGPKLAEPHPSWMTLVAADWEKLVQG